MNWGALRRSRHLSYHVWALGASVIADRALGDLRPRPELRGDAGRYKAERDQRK